MVTRFKKILKGLKRTNGISIPLLASPLKEFRSKTFQRFGIVKNYWIETGSDKIDEGRYAVTKKEEDRYVFRVHALRDLPEIPSRATREQVMAAIDTHTLAVAEIMGRYQRQIQKAG